MRAYRKLVENHYKIKIPSGYDVHHIDLNHSNDKIANLMILPKKLHNQYHLMLGATAPYPSKHERAIDIRISGNAVNARSYSKTMLKKLMEVISECDKWYDYKLYLDGLIPNIHGIVLEEAA